MSDSAMHPMLAPYNPDSDFLTNMIPHHRWLLMLPQYLKVGSAIRAWQKRLSLDRPKKLKSMVS